MSKGLYAVRDIVAQTIIGGIIMEPADAPAIRAFYDALRTKGSLLAEHPADFTLLHLGNIDLATGELMYTNTTVVATGTGWLEQNT
ncbi:MAG: nonstructural protein [Microvirus sp.]|nr:MAG: nonstructural protein [Microvirus sp.]